MATSYQDIGAVQSSGLPSIGAVQAAGGSTPVNETLTDTLSLSDAVGLGLGLIFSADGLSFSDVIALNEPLAAVVINDATWVNVLADTQQYQLNSFMQLSDTEALSDTFLLTPGLILGTEALALSDAIQAFAGTPLSFSEDFAFSDAIAVQNYGVLSETPSDALSLSDAVVDRVVSFLTIKINVSPPAGDIQMNTGGGAYPEIPPDYFSFGDTFSLKMLSVYSFADTLTLSDAITVFLQATPTTESLTDSLVLSDSLAFGITPVQLIVSLSDDFAFQDAVQRLEAGFEYIATIQDSLFLQDNVVVNNALSLTSYLRRYLNDVSL
jgi:hypothetical protein